MANALFFPSKIQSSPRSGTSRLRVCDVLCDIDGCDQHTFLMAAWADAALLTGKCDEQAVATIWAAHPGEAFAQVAANSEKHTASRDGVAVVQRRNRLEQLLSVFDGELAVVGNTPELDVRKED